MTRTINNRRRNQKNRHKLAALAKKAEQSSICVVDAFGKIAREAKIPSTPEALIGWFTSFGVGLTRIGLEDLCRKGFTPR
jgi:hypothetical protein